MPSGGEPVSPGAHGVQVHAHSGGDALVGIAAGGRQHDLGAKLVPMRVW
jgi:uncharacterized cupin superfamily protein